MFVLLLVGLYTSRINLQSLGVDDFGVYNVVAGFVVMFSALTGALGNAISRFIQVELGKGDNDKLKLVFSTSLTVQIIIGVIMIVLIEAIGIWFIDNKMQIPQESLSAAIWVLQFSIISFVVGLLYVPYYSCIIAHERMSAFAFISLLEAIIKLIIAFVVAYTPYNKLITFAALLLLNQFLVTTLYIVYCRRHFMECAFNLSYDKDLVKEMSSFVGWNVFAHGASILSVQGVNMLMNVFFGVIVNAARAIETQVNNAVQQFISSFTTALIPPITKSYAADDKDSAFDLVFKGDRYSYYLMLLISLPIIFETDAILSIWLKTPPDYSSIFVCWTLAASLAKVLGGNTIFALIMADGNIKNFQLAIAIVGLLPLPLSWLAFAMGLSVVSAYVIYFLIHVLLIFVRLYYAKVVTGLSISIYLNKVLNNVVLVTLASVLIPFLLKQFIPGNQYWLLIVLVTLLSTVAAIIFLGMKKEERLMFIRAAKSFLHK